LLPGDGKWLARESSGNDINQPLIARGEPFTDECFDIAEDGSVGQDSVTDSGGNDSLAIVVPLHISDGPETKEHGSEKPAACA
jgi:hypothetical protein